MAKNNNISAVMIIEIAGRPPKHLSEALVNHIAKIEVLKDVEVTSKKFSEPTQINKEKDIYSCFAEVEVEVETMFKLTELIFDFMPSSVEVLDPENVSMNSQEASMFLNDLSGRLHKYDEVAKIAQLRNKQLMVAYENLQGQIASGSKKDTKEKSTKKAKKKKK